MFFSKHSSTASLEGSAGVIYVRNGELHEAILSEAPQRQAKLETMIDLYCMGGWDLESEAIDLAGGYLMFLLLGCQMLLR